LRPRALHSERVRLGGGGGVCDTIRGADSSRHPEEVHLLASRSGLDASGRLHVLVDYGEVDRVVATVAR
jgi:hypothetical protein